MSVPKAITTQRNRIPEIDVIHKPFLVASKPEKSLKDGLQQVIKSGVGTSSWSIPNTEHGNLGCAAMVDAAIYAATGHKLQSQKYSVLHVKGIHEALHKDSMSANGHFEQIKVDPTKSLKSQLRESDVVVSLAKIGKDGESVAGHGHTGIAAADGEIYSNSSSKRAWKHNYNAKQWEMHYGATYIFRPRATAKASGNMDLAGGVNDLYGTHLVRNRARKVEAKEVAKLALVNARSHLDAWGDRSGVKRNVATRTLMATVRKPAHLVSVAAKAVAPKIAKVEKPVHLAPVTAKAVASTIAKVAAPKRHHTPVIVGPTLVTKTATPKAATSETPAQHHAPAAGRPSLVAMAARPKIAKTEVPMQYHALAAGGLLFGTKTATQKIAKALVPEVAALAVPLLGADIGGISPGHEKQSKLQVPEIAAMTPTSQSKSVAPKGTGIEIVSVGRKIGEKRRPVRPKLLLTASLGFREFTHALAGRDRREALVA